MFRDLRRRVTRQHLAFLVVGAINTVVGYAVYGVLATWVLAEVPFGYLIALVASYVVGIGVAFVLYRRFVFHVSGNVLVDLVRFVGVYVVAIVVNFVLLPVLVELVGLPPLLAQILVIAVTTVMSFFGHREISFRRPAPVETVGDPEAPAPGCAE